MEQLMTECETTKITIRLILPGTVRIKKNSRRLFGSGKRKINLPSKAYMAWEEIARQKAFLQLRGYARSVFLPTDKPVAVKVLAYYKGQKPDLSGVLESVGDCLEGVVYENDKQVFSWDGSRLFHNLKNPRTEVTVEVVI